MKPGPSMAFAATLALTKETSALAVARRAYHLWEMEGRPHGSDLQHWLQAETEIALELAQAIANAPGAPRLMLDKSESGESPRAGRCV